MDMRRGLLIGGGSLIAVVALAALTRHHDASPSATTFANNPAAPNAWSTDRNSPLPQPDARYNAYNNAPAPVSSSQGYAERTYTPPPSATPEPYSYDSSYRTYSAYGAPSPVAPPPAAYVATAPVAAPAPVAYTTTYVERPVVRRTYVTQRRYVRSSYAPRTRYRVYRKRPLKHSVAIVAGSAAGGALIGGLAGGGKGAGIGAVAGGGAGFIYDRLTHKKRVE